MPRTLLELLDDLVDQCWYSTVDDRHALGAYVEIHRRMDELVKHQELCAWTCPKTNHILNGTFQS